MIYTRVCVCVYGNDVDSMEASYLRTQFNARNTSCKNKIKARSKQFFYSLQERERCWTKGDDFLRNLMPSLKGKYGKLLIYSALSCSREHSQKLFSFHIHIYVKCKLKVNCTAWGLIEYEEVSFGQLSNCQFLQF